MKLRIIFDKCEKKYFLQEKGWVFWHKCYRWDAGISDGKARWGFDDLAMVELYAKMYRFREAVWRITKKQLDARDRFVVISPTV